MTRRGYFIDGLVQIKRKKVSGDEAFQLKGGRVSELYVNSSDETHQSMFGYDYTLHVSPEWGSLPDDKKSIT